MIISKLKDKNEILKNLSSLQRIFVIGCSECATVCKSGGEEEAKEMCEFLAREGKEATGYIIIESPCVEAKAKMELLKSTKKINESD
ncbi:MAG: 5,10-methylenetetrahydrofolate reductase, partial [Candidatus Omnitrophota bacterium]